jgi:sucrose-6-phosphate hydrolase SacC (GH32 family)
MEEDAPLADFGELAWAPHVIKAVDTYHLFWSPHRLHRMTSADGVAWGEHRVVMTKPFHRFFRDAAIINVAEGQWLLYCTARGRYFSRVDVYQSFDLDGWQYIGPALRTGLGAERNGIVASTESPAVVTYRDRFYLALTYNNDSFFWPALQHNILWLAWLMI